METQQLETQADKGPRAGDGSSALGSSISESRRSHFLSITDSALGYMPAEYALFALVIAALQIVNTPRSVALTS